MDALKYLEEKNRMTKLCYVDCDNCQLGRKNNGEDVSCVALEKQHPKIAVSIVEKWREENPLVTNLDKFKEVKDNILKTFNLSEYDFECDCYGTKLPGILCKKFHNCDECEEFWKSEYKGDEK